MSQTPTESSFSHTSSPRRNGLSFTIRELLLVLVIAALLMTVFYPRAKTSTNPNAFLRVNEPVRYSYWHQDGDKGSGTGVGQWQEAEGIEFFAEYIIVYLPEGGKLIPREHLTHFLWLRNPAAQNRGYPQPAGATLGSDIWQLGINPDACPIRQAKSKIESLKTILSIALQSIITRPDSIRQSQFRSGKTCSIRTTSWAPAS